MESFRSFQVLESKSQSEEEEKKTRKKTLVKTGANASVLKKLGVIPRGGGLTVQ